MTIILLIIIVAWGLISLIYLKGNNSKEKLLFSGFLILIFSIIYSVSFLGFKIGGSNVAIEEVEKGWFVKYINGGRPFTGYHLWLNAFVLVVLHFPLVFMGFNWRLECLLIGFLFASWQTEDFLWFVFNPAYGIKNFKPEKYVVRTIIKGSNCCS